MGDEQKRTMIEDAATVVDFRGPPPKRVPSDPHAREVTPTPPIPGPLTEVLMRATEALPAIDIPTHATRELERRSEAARVADDDTAPRIGEYALIARFPSSASADVFLGYKVTNFGFIRRAVVKWTDRSRPDFDGVREALLDEGRAISFVDHPNIVTILDLADDPAGTYMALEYVAGTDLRRVMVELARRKASMPVHLITFVICEVLRGLAHVHSARGPDGKPLEIVHRDVNPSNVLVSEDGHVKLTDFGTVLMQGRLQESTAPGMVKGKVRYLAPEYIADQLCTYRVDLYSVGVMMFELLTGEPCFQSTSSTHTMVRIVKEGLPISELEKAGVPAPLVDIVARATHREPDARFPSADAMSNAIEDWMSAEGLFSSASKFSAYLYAEALYA